MLWQGAVPPLMQHLLLCCTWQHHHRQTSCSEWLELDCRFKELEECAEEVELKYLLRKSLQDWEVHTEAWLSTELFAIQPSVMEDVVNEYNKIAHRVERGLPSAKVRALRWGAAPPTSASALVPTPHRQACRFGLGSLSSVHLSAIGGYLPAVRLCRW